VSIVWEAQRGTAHELKRTAPLMRTGMAPIDSGPSFRASFQGQSFQWLSDYLKAQTILSSYKCYGNRVMLKEGFPTYGTSIRESDRTAG